MSSHLPEPRLTRVYRLDTTLAPPLEVGDASALDWVNKGVFISGGGRQAAGVIYETYLVG